MWAGKGFWAIMDQGLVATSNFILNMLLARWLSPSEYGVFAVAYTIFLFVATFHTAILNEPMLVFGPSTYKDRVRAYLRVLIFGHWALAIIIGAFYFLAYLALWRFTISSLTPAFLALAIASPFILFQWMMRRACYINIQPHLAAIGGLGYMVLVFLGALGLHHLKSANSANALFIMGFSSLFSGSWLYYKLGLHYKKKDDINLIRNTLSDHWRYGRWALGTAVLSWVPGNVFMLFVPIWWGLEASAAYKALINLLVPIMNINTALAAILLPILVARRGTSDFKILIVRSAFGSVIGATLYWLLLGAFGKPITHLLYSGNYSEIANWLWLAGLIPILGASVNIAGVALRAMELPNKIFYTYIAATILSLTLGLTFVREWGVGGAIFGWLAAYIVTAYFMNFGLLKSFKDQTLKGI